MESIPVNIIVKSNLMCIYMELSVNMYGSVAGTLKKSVSIIFVVITLIYKSDKQNLWWFIGSMRMYELKPVWRMF